MTSLSSRRTALGALLGAAVASLASTSIGKKRRRKSHQPRKRSTGRNRVAAQASCASPGPSTNLNSCNFNNQDLIGIDLSSSSMRGTKFRGANLCGADLSSSQLKDADFRGFAAGTGSGRPTNLFRADLSSSGCSGTQFNTRTLFCNTRTCNGNISNRDCPRGINPAEICCRDADCRANQSCFGGICVCNQNAGTWENQTTFGSHGSSPSQFNFPIGVAVSEDGQTAWVADADNHRVSVWNLSGSGWSNQTTFGGQGSGPSQFNRPLRVAASGDGQTVWVADTSNHRVSVWTRTGPTTWANVTTFGSLGSGPNQFSNPEGVAVSSDGQTVWVTDVTNHRVSVWTRTGPTTWANQTTFGTQGSGPTEFSSPEGVTAASDGQTVWVADTQNHRVSVWVLSGSGWSNLTTFGSFGSGPNQFSFPKGVAVSGDGQTVWVADSVHNRVSVWGKTGPATWANLTTFGSLGSGPSELRSPIDVAATGNGQSVWVADLDNHRISVWALTCPTG